jgi:hypothetical protein
VEKEFNIQVRFFTELKNKIPPNLSMVDMVSDELNISTDSAYRRIRGETNLTIEELRQLSHKFEISLDAIFTYTSNSVLFSYRAINPEKFNYKDYFNSIIENMKALETFNLKEIVYGAKDIPIFYFFILPRVAAFKLFFWMCNIYSFPDFEYKIFNSKDIPEELINVSRKVWESYVHIPSIEIWSEETYKITLRQIEYYYISGRFRDKADALELLYDYRKIFEHVRKQAEHGCKFLYGKEPWGDDQNYKLYFNEVIISDNTILFKMGDFNMVHMGHNVMNILSTTDPTFCRDTNIIQKNLMKNSTLISVVGEKDRNRLFNQISKSINEFIERIEKAP